MGAADARQQQAPPRRQRAALDPRPDRALVGVGVHHQNRSAACTDRSIGSDSAGDEPQGLGAQHMRPDVGGPLDVADRQDRVSPRAVTALIPRSDQSRGVRAKNPPVRSCQFSYGFNKSLSCLPYIMIDSGDNISRCGQSTGCSVMSPVT